VSRYAANTYRDKVEHGVPMTAKTVADLRTVTNWPTSLVLDIHVDLHPRCPPVRFNGRYLPICNKKEAPIFRRRASNLLMLAIGLIMVR
jgi:hypothetical protein